MDNLLYLKHDVAFPSPILTKADDRAKILVRHRLLPHRVRPLKASIDPEFTEKTCDVAGLYMDPRTGRC